jgi:hypothetical protein
MLYGALPTIPITEFRTKQPEILQHLKRSPIMFTRQGHGAGVLLHPRVFNDLVRVYQLALEAGLLEVDQSDLLDWEEVERAFYQQEPVHAVAEARNA